MAGLAVVGCAAKHECYFGCDCLNREIVQRTGHDVGTPRCDDGFDIPDGIILDDGLTEDEAVAVALWNNRAFQEAMAELGITRADLIQAGLINNPTISILFPLSVKQLEFTAKVPIEALWVRPHRIAAASLESQRVGRKLVQTGLDLVRDVRLAHRELLLADEHVRLANEAQTNRGRVADLADARLKNGDVSPFDVVPFKTEVMRGREETIRRQQERLQAELKLRHLLGLSFANVPVRAVVGEPAVDFRPEWVSPNLIDQAVDSRPDYQSALLAAEAASARVTLARKDWITANLLFDANQKGQKGFEIGPGVELPIPIFNWNEGHISRAEAEYARAARQALTIRQAVAIEIRLAQNRMAAAQQSLAIWRGEIVPTVEEAARRAERAYQSGDTSILLVLETTRQVLDARLKSADAAAELGRAAAELEHGIGQRLHTLPVTSEGPPEPGRRTLPETPATEPAT